MAFFFALKKCDGSKGRRTSYRHVEHCRSIPGLHPASQGRDRCSIHRTTEVRMHIGESIISLRRHDTAIVALYHRISENAICILDSFSRRARKVERIVPTIYLSRSVGTDDAVCTARAPRRRAAGVECQQVLCGIVNRQTQREISLDMIHTPM